jgi:hypothetical protein
MQERKDGLAGTKQGMFLSRRPGYLGHDIGPPIGLGGRKDDLSTVPGVIFIPEAGPGSRTAFYIYRMPGLG